MARSAWLTPQGPPSPALICRALRMPGGRDYEAAVRGALLSLCESENWEQIGAQTPDAVAEWFQETVLQSIVDWEPCSVYWERLLAIAPDNLIAYWRLAESSGSTASDSSGQGNHGTVSGATWGADGIGDDNTAADFDGVNDYIDASSTGLLSTFDPDAGSLLLWFRAADMAVWDGTTRRVLLAIHADDNNRFWVHYDYQYDRFRAFRIAGGVYSDCMIEVEDTDWHCFVTTWDTGADEARFYLDGVEQGDAVTGLGTWSGTPSLITAGGLAQYYAWWGALAHIAVWDRVLTSDEVAELGAV